MSAVAVIAAGGSGTRFGGNTPKQFLLLQGIPLLVHTLRAFENASSIEKGVLVLPSSEIGRVDPAFLRRYEISKIHRIVPGGTTRQASVHRGLEAIEGEPDYVAVHDAARCLVTSDLIDRTVRACDGWDGAVAALPVGDTIKRVESETIVDTLDRTALWGMQTPQVFRFSFLRDAYRWAEKNGLETTDEAAVAEQRQARIRVVRGSPRNFKVTLPEDLELAEQILGGAR